MDKEAGVGPGAVWGREDEYDQNTLYGILKKI